MFYGVGVSCRILYSIVSYLYVSCSGSITSVGEERANVSAIVYLCCVSSERFPLPLGAWGGLRCFIMAPLSLPYNISSGETVLDERCLQYYFSLIFVAMKMRYLQRLNN